VERVIENEKAPISKEVNGFIQVARWKDVNVFALEQSSKKSHHFLLKNIKKYRLILRRPFMKFLEMHKRQEYSPPVKNLFNASSLPELKFGVHESVEDIIRFLKQRSDARDTGKYYFSERLLRKMYQLKAEFNEGESD
jgi:midasin (ATPase involved in ribosome maturation)